MKRTIKASLVALDLLLGLAAPVVAGPFEDALTAWDRSDYATALQLIRPLAVQGDAGGQYYLGIMYANGWGVPQDYAEAARLYRLAADRGYALAQNNLGDMYANGQGVPRDYVQAHMWLSLAVARLPPGANNAAKRRDLLAAKMTSAQIAEAQRLAREWKPK
jgi:uncharacterized protein